MNKFFEDVFFWFKIFFGLMVIGLIIKFFESLTAWHFIVFGFLLLIVIAAWKLKPWRHWFGGGFR